MSDDEPTTDLQTGPVGQFPTFLFPPPNCHTLIDAGDPLVKAGEKESLSYKLFYYDARTSSVCESSVPQSKRIPVTSGDGSDFWKQTRLSIQLHDPHPKSS